VVNLHLLYIVGSTTFMFDFLILFIFIRYWHVTFATKHVHGLLVYIFLTNAELEVDNFTGTVSFLSTFYCKVYLSSCFIRKMQVSNMLSLLISMSCKVCHLTKFFFFFSRSYLTTFMHLHRLSTMQFDLFHFF
jgi:hypothetical protein